MLVHWTASNGYIQRIGLNGEGWRQRWNVLRREGGIDCFCARVDVWDMAADVSRPVACRVGDHGPFLWLPRARAWSVMGCAGGTVFLVEGYWLDVSFDAPAGSSTNGFVCAPLV